MDKPIRHFLQFSDFSAEEHRWVLEPGQFEILVGTSATDIRLRAFVSVG